MWAHVDALLAGDARLVVPAIFRAELTASLAHRGWLFADIELATAPIHRRVDETLTLGPKRAERVAQLAALARLRAADAF